MTTAIRAAFIVGMVTIGWWVAGYAQTPLAATTAYGLGVLITAAAVYIAVIEPHEQEEDR